MVCQCPVHGQQYGVLVSPDLDDVLRVGQPASGVVRIEYLHEGVQTGLMYLSVAYATTNGVPKCRTLPLSAQYPSWALGLVPACSLCALEVLEESTMLAREDLQDRSE
jgi:hypothetical protein